MKYALIIFRDNYRKYTYKTDIEDLKKGDVVLVPTPDGPMEVEFIKYLKPSQVDLNIEYKEIYEKVKSKKKKSLFGNIFSR